VRTKFDIYVFIELYVTLCPRKVVILDLQSVQKRKVGWKGTI